MIFGIGTDCVQIDRIEKLLNQFEEKTLKRLFTPTEIARADKSTCAENKIRTFAKRFAAKEAVSKALGTGLGKIGLTDIEVQNQSTGQPQIVLHGAAQIFAQTHGIKRVHISLSHSEVYAIATAIVEEG